VDWVLSTARPAYVCASAATGGDSIQHAQPFQGSRQLHPDMRARRSWGRCPILILPCSQRAALHWLPCASDGKATTAAWTAAAAADAGPTRQRLLWHTASGVGQRGGPPQPVQAVSVHARAGRKLTAERSFGRQVEPAATISRALRGLPSLAACLDLPAHYWSPLLRASSLDAVVQSWGQRHAVARHFGIACMRVPHSRSILTTLPYHFPLPCSSLNSNNLTGRLPGSWALDGAFPALVELHLGNNHLGGPLPSSWAKGNSSFPNLLVW
jgi:hypothetical protein